MTGVGALEKSPKSSSSSSSTTGFTLEVVDGCGVEMMVGNDE